MKKIIAIAAIFAAIASIATAQDANRMKYVQILEPSTALNKTSSVVNVSAYKGNATLAVQFSAGSIAATATVTFAHASAATGTYSTVTNTAGTAAVIRQIGPATNDIQTVSIDTARLKPFVRAVLVQSGEDTNSVSAFFVAPMKSE